MSAPTVDVFDKWLGEKLISINPDADLEVFVSYVRGILEDDEEDQLESLSGVLSQIAEDDIEDACTCIISQWKAIQANIQENTDNKPSGETLFEKQILSIVEKQQTQVVQSKVVSEEAKARKAAILAQYAQVADGAGTDDDEDEKESGGAVGGSADDDLLNKNFNALMISQRESEQRDKMRLEHEKKKLRDKEEREKQKQKAQDRKESEKKRTQKGEKRR